MKKLKNIVFILIVMMFISIINVDAAGLSIKNIRLVDHTGNATELSEPKINGLNINFDLSFTSLGDTATYEVILNNPTNKEYEINTDKQFSKSNYISYSYELKDKTNRIKANSEVTLNVIIKYENQVPADKLVNGKYEENNDMGIDLLNEDNPSTFNNILLLIIILIILIGLTLIMIKTKYKNSIVIVFVLLMVPVTVFALEKLKLTVSTKITIDVETYNVYYSMGNVIKANELDNADYYDECEQIKIRHSDDSIEDYYICNYLYKKDSEKYPVGSIVNIKSVAVVNIRDSISRYCSLDSDDVYICNENLVDYTHSDRFEYTCAVNLENVVYGRKVLNKCSEEEFINMFNFPIGWKGDYGYIHSPIPESFKMPSHDVYILGYKLYLE